MPELLEALNWLMRHTNSWGLEHDVALLHLCGYWKKMFGGGSLLSRDEGDKHDAEKSIIETDISGAPITHPSFRASLRAPMAH